MDFKIMNILIVIPANVSNRYLFKAVFEFYSMEVWKDFPTNFHSFCIIYYQNLLSCTFILVWTVYFLCKVGGNVTDYMYM